MPFEVDSYVKEFSKIVDDQFALIVGNEKTAVYTNEQIDNDIEIWMSIFEVNSKLAVSNFIAEMQYDVVYGNDQWTARERFQNQKTHVNGALAALGAVEASQSAIDCIDEKLKQLKKPISAPKDHYTAQYNSYIDNEAKAYAKEATKEKIAQYNFRGFGPRTGFFIAGMVILGIGVLAFFTTSLLLLESIYIDGLEAGKIAPFMIIFPFIALIGLFVLIPALSLKKQKKNAYREVKIVENQTKAKLKSALSPVLNEYNRSYYQIIVDAEASAKQVVIDDYNQKREQMVEAHSDAVKYFDEHYPFAKNFDWQTLSSICEAMRNGIAESYSSALRYVLDEQKKAEQRAQDLAIKQEEMRIQAEHNSKMEQMSYAQLEAAQRQAAASEATALNAQRAAAAAEQQAKAAEQQAKAAKETAKQVKKTNNILKGWE